MTEVTIDPMVLTLVNLYVNEKQVKTYNTLHDVDNKYNYKTNTLTNVDHKGNAKFIKDNLSKMDDEELIYMLSKCLSPQQMRGILLRYELEYYEEKPVESLTLTEFETKALRILSKYQSKAGGFLLEDNEWITFSHDSKEHTVQVNELLIQNSTNMLDRNDDELVDYLDMIETRLNSLCKNISVELLWYKDKKDNLVYVNLWAVDKNIKVNTSEMVGL